MKYRLHTYEIIMQNQDIFARKYIFIESENLLRAFISPVIIDEVHDSLLIQADIIKGEDLSVSPDLLSEEFSALPLWDKTSYYMLIFKNCHQKFFCKTNIEIVDRR